MNRLGPDLVTLAVGPADDVGDYTSLVIYDPMNVPAFDAGALVLAVGVSAESALALRLAAARPAALVVRHDGPVGQPFLTEALDAGVALLVVPTSCDWASVFATASSLPGHVPPFAADPTSESEVVSDLFTVANALAETLDAPVTIEDNQSRLLAYSAFQGDVDVARAATILGHRVPNSFRHEVRRRGVAKRMLTETEPFFIATTDTDINPRTVVTLRVQDEVIGSIWAVTDTPLDAARTAALAEAARSIAVRLAHHRLTSDLRRRHAEATMALLLRGGTGAVEAGRRLGLEGEAFRLVAIAATHPADGNEGPIERCATALKQHLSMVHTAKAVARVGDVVYAVLPGSADHAESLAAARKVLLACRVTARLESAEQIVMGISGPVTGLAELCAGREEADRVLQVLAAARSHDGCAEVGEVGLAVSMLRLAEMESARRAGRRNVLDDIDDYDKAHATSYSQTLRAYLGSFGDPTKVSKSLGVHTNTLRYRLRRLHELFDVDISDADTRFALMVDIRLRTPGPGEVTSPGGNGGTAVGSPVPEPFS
ncbi:PucR family transcriptional regulator [Streptomyces aurantiacus]|uniref:PucR family transcriptional regulator n=1 Tax=Streptomyces aurantiacus TaxID=47760 RepID=UPI0027D84DC8|nr:PucR family transcriptional regulator [Streptomyces aurantiacus]